MKNKIFSLIVFSSLLLSFVEGQNKFEMVGTRTTVDTRDSIFDEWLTGGTIELDTRDFFEITLSSSTILEQQPSGSKVGTLVIDGGGNANFSLVQGTGSNGNSNFNLSKEGVLKTSKSFDYKSAQEHTIRVRAISSSDASSEKTFTISVIQKAVSSNLFGEVSAGTAYSLFTKSNGSLWAVGKNVGQLGDGTLNHKSLPVQIENKGVSKIFAGEEHSLFIKSDGSLWGMGDSHYGELGEVIRSPSNDHPIEIESSGVESASLGRNHSLYIKSDGSLWGMGNNPLGQLGNGPQLPHHGAPPNAPVKIVSDGVVDVSAGRYSSFFVKSNGSLWGMGENTFGQLGDGTTTNRKAPVRIVSSGVVSVSTSYWGGYTLFVKNDGSLWGMGSNSVGQLGFSSSGYSDKRLLPVEIESSEVVSVSVGRNYSVYLKSDGSFWGIFGHGTWLGHPKNPVLLESSGVVRASAGERHLLYIKSDGSFWGIGRNSFGQLGDGSTIERKTPTLISGLKTAQPSLVLSREEVWIGLPKGTVLAQIGSKNDGVFTLSLSDFELSSGTGDENNDWISIQGNQVKAAKSLVAGKVPEIIRFRIVEEGSKESQALIIQVIQKEFVDPFKKAYEEALLTLEAMRNEVADLNSSYLRNQINLENLKSESELLLKDLDLKNAKLQELSLQKINLSKTAETLEKEINSFQEKMEISNLRIADFTSKISSSTMVLEELEQDLLRLREEKEKLLQIRNVPHLSGWHYLLNQGWILVDPDFYPLVYRAADETWLSYEQGTFRPWNYYNHSTESMETWD